MKLRSFADFRQFPFYTGIIQALYGSITALDLEGGLFHALMVHNNLGREWGWVMIITAIYLMGAALFRRRQTLHIALFLSALVWSVISLMMTDVWLSEFQYLGITRHWFVPGMMIIPPTAVMMWVCLFREMLVCPVQIPERRKSERA